MIDILPMVLQAAPVSNLTAIYNLTNSTAAIVSPASIDSGLMVFVEETIAVVILLLMVLAISLQLARGYFLRILRKFTLRLTADLWWLIYILLRDLTVFLVLFLGFVLFLPSANLAYPVAVPFMPLGIDLYAFALVLILVKETDEDGKYDTLVTTLLAAGTALYMIGTIGVTESAVQLAQLPGTVSPNASNPWGFFFTYFNSVNNPALEMYSFYITFALLVIAGLYAIKWSFNPTGAKPKTVPNPIAKTGPVPPAVAQRAAAPAAQKPAPAMSAPASNQSSTQ